VDVQSIASRKKLTQMSAHTVIR